VSTSLQLSLQMADARHRLVLPRHRVSRWVRLALGGRPAQITVRVVGSEEARRLNREFRAKDYATNVLTFDYATQPAVLADIVLCAEVIEQEAKEQGVALQDHYAHLTLHGVLHALGHDHLQARQARAMEAIEVACLARLGISDPYRRHR
jgi:probable rRNA maturation factor